MQYKQEHTPNKEVLMYINNNHSTVGAYGRMGMGSTIDAYGRTCGKPVKTPPVGQQADRAGARFELPENTRGQVRAPAAASQNSRDTVTIGSYLRIETTVTYRARLNISAAPAAAPVEETAGTAETDRGANSAAVMNAVGDNKNWVSNAVEDKNGYGYVFWPSSGETRRLELICIPGQFGEFNRPGKLQVDGGQQQQEEFENWCVEHGGYEKAREFVQNNNLMKLLTSTLDKRGIALEEHETFGISVDMYCKVTVTGSNKEKAAAIEKVLNSVPDGENWGLLLNKNSIHDMDGFASQMFKMLMSNYIEGASGGAVTLNDLHVENGKIMGLPPELDEFINSIEADPYFDAKRVDEWFREEMDNNEVRKQFFKDNPLLPTNGGGLNNFIEEHPNQKSYDLKTVLTELLTTGVKNIPDVSAKVVIGNGSLAWC
jgi:hypothetical protein